MNIKRILYTNILALAAAFLFNTSTLANTPTSDDGATVTDVLADSTRGRHAQEKPRSRWALAFDNDILVPSSRDQDYTYGISFTTSGRLSRSSRVSMHRQLALVNQHIGLAESDSSSANYSIEIGLYGFTPEDISVKTANHDDRPYAGLLYLSSSKSEPGATSNTAWHSNLTVGVLGLDLIGELQNGVHSATSSEKARGWDKQISDGGELTARYSLAHQRLWNSSNPKIEIKSSTQASVGYLSEVSWSVNMRIGKIDSEWKSFNPELASYREQATQPTGSSSRNDSYFIVGVSLKARAYNAFLQGQFRDSEVSYSSDELNHGIVEAWIGYTHAFNSGYRLSYLLRGHSSEIKEGSGNRNVMWGGLVLEKMYFNF